MEKQDFFGNDILLTNETAMMLYERIKDLPIVDYHCHLNEKEIAKDKVFSSLGELWLSGDHYKWRAMRLCGVDEYYITGGASYDEKFMKYAEIFPLLIGNPLYYFTQLELKILFGITLPLNRNNAPKILTIANEKLKNLHVSDILEMFHVEYIATTDDPVSTLVYHGIYGKTKVAPTFRPDRILTFDDKVLAELSAASGIATDTLDGVKKALSSRLTFFSEKGCVIADHGMDFLPLADCNEVTAASLFERRHTLDKEDLARLVSHMTYYLAEEYAHRGMVMQLHFGTFRNVNTEMFKTLGKDAGFDVMRSEVDIDRLAVFFDTLQKRNALPKTVLYSLNPSAVIPLCTLSGAFPNIRVGAAWWFNDSLFGIKKQLETIAEYAVLGTSLGMLTDSRSFASYVRFDFFRRILASFVGERVEKGEYDITSAEELMKRICYSNIKDFLSLT